MIVTINGNETEIPEESTITDLLLAWQVESPDTVAVELNGVILSRNQYRETMVREKDTLEFLYFLGGG